MSHHHPEAVVATVDGIPIHRHEVEDVLARMRSGPAAGLLPRDGGAEGRQLRRWLVQLLTVERLVEQTAAGWGADSGEVDEMVELDQITGLELGSVLTAVLLSSPAARTVYWRVTEGLEPTEEQIADYYRRNRDDLTEPETRLVRLVPDVHDGRSEQSLGWVLPSQLPSGPVTVAGGRWRVVVDDVRPGRVPGLAEARERIVTELGGAARRHAFVSWVERARQDRVVLHEGYEHPADPRQPDNTHRH
jgi:[acyl-carrier-protein] S-malonyltransferase